MKMHKWSPELPTTDTELNMMIQFVVSELQIEEENLDKVVVIAGDTLVMGCVDQDTGAVQLFECTIRRSNLTPKEAAIYMVPLAANEGDPS